MASPPTSVNSSLADLAVGVPMSQKRTEVAIVIRKGQESPPLPYELIGLIPETDWSERIGNLTGLLNKFHWSTIQLVWLILVVIASAVLPFPITAAIHHAYRINSPQKMMGGHAIAMGVLIALFALLWVPVVLYGRIGRSRIHKLMHSYSAVDAELGLNYALHWRINLTGTPMERNSVTLFISLPMTGSFAQDAYLPRYISERLPSYGNEANTPRNGSPTRSPSQRSDRSSAASLTSIRTDSRATSPTAVPAQAKVNRARSLTGPERPLSGLAHLQLAQEHSMPTQTNKPNAHPSAVGGGFIGGGFTGRGMHVAPLEPPASIHQSRFPKLSRKTSNASTNSTRSSRSSTFSSRDSALSSVVEQARLTELALASDEAAPKAGKSSGRARSGTVRHLL